LAAAAEIKGRTDKMTAFEIITRRDMYLAKIAGQSVSIPEHPVTREEMYLAKLAGQNVDVPHPVTRNEMFLAKLCGMDYTLVPITRAEMMMAKAAGMEVPAIEPITREEFLWRDIADKEPPAPPVVKFTITYTVGSQSTSETINEGDSITIAAAPTAPEGYEFTGWTYNGTTYLPTAVITPTGDMTFVAAFEEIPSVDDPWAAVFKAERDGTYKEKYKIGDTIPLDLGSEGIVNMQIAAFDADNLADGSGKAKITWISKELLKTEHRMNPARAGGSGNYTEGTGAIGGWKKCEMRTYLNDTIKPLMPANVQTAIKAVHKTHPAYNSAGSSFTQTTDDEVWLPSYNEMFASSSSTNQPRYEIVFPDAESRQKIVVGETRPNNWWLRSPYSSSNFYYVNSSGNYYDYYADYALEVVLCFCT
jgi:hypothetical protein